MAKSRKRVKEPREAGSHDRGEDTLKTLEAAAGALSAAAAWDKLASLYEARLRQSEDPAVSLEIASRAAEVYLDRLASPRKAEEMGWVALRIDGAARAPYDLLHRLYDSTKNHRKAAYLEYHRATSLGPGPERAAAFHSLGVLWRDRLGNRLRALTFFNAAVRAGHGLEAVQAADAVCAELQMNEESARLLSVEETLSQDRMLLANRFLDLGLKLAENPLLHDRARVFLKKALELKPASKAAKRALEGLDTFFEAYEEAVDALRDEAVDTRDRGRAAALYRYIAEAYFMVDGPEGLKRTREYLDRSLMLDPVSAPGVDLLARLLAADGDVAALVSALEKKAQEIRSNKTGSEIYFRIGWIWFEKAGDAAKAEQAWKRAVEMNPENRDARRFLADFLEERGRADEAAAHLEALLKAPGDQMQDAAVHLKLAEHAWEKGDAGTAALHAMTALDTLPPSAPVLARLAQFLEKSGDRDGLAAILGSLSAFEPEPSARLEHVLTAAPLFKEKGAHEQAFALYRIALAIEPWRKSIHEPMEDLAEAGIGWKRVAEAYAEEAVKYPGDEKMLSLNRKLALIFGERLGEPAKAAEHLRLVLAVDEEDVEAARELSRLMTQVGDAGQLAEALRREVQVARRAGEKVATLKRLAAIQEEKLSDFDGAVETCREILSLDRTDSETLDRLLSLLDRAGRPGDLAALYEEEIGRAAHGREKNVLRLKLSALLADRLGRADDAVRLVEEALADEPENAEAISLLETFAAKGLSAVRVSELLAPRYRALGQWRRYVESLERRILTETGAAARFSILHEIGGVYEEHLSQKDMAFATFCRALRENPSDGTNREDIERLAGETRGFEELCLLYGEESRRDAVPADARAAMLRVAAGLQERELEDPAAAAESLGRLLELTPGDESSVRSLVAINRRIGNAHGLAGAMLRLAGMTGNADERREVLHEAARIYEAELRDDDGAVKVFTKILETDEQDLATLRKLDRLYEKRGDWNALADVLEREAAFSQEPVEKAEILYRLGRTWRERLNGPEVAVEYFAKALSENPGMLSALGALESLLEDPAVGAKVVPVLEAQHRGRGEWDKLVAVLERKLGMAAGDERRGIYDELVEIYEKQMNHRQMAFAAACRAFREFPGDDRLLARLEKAAGDGGFGEELAAVLEEVTEAGGLAPARATALLSRAAEICETELRDTIRALEIQNKVLAADPGNSGALRALERLQKAAGNYQELVAVYQQKLNLAATDEERKDLYFEMASVLEEKLGDIRGAREAYLRVLEIDPKDLISLRTYQGFCERIEDWPELARSLEAEIGLSEDPAYRRDLALRLARLRLERLEDIEGALGLVGQVQEGDPADAGARNIVESLFESGRERARTGPMLARAAEAAGDWTTYARTFEIMAAGAAGLEDRAEMYALAAAACRDRIGDVERAFLLFSSAFSAWPARTSLAEDAFALADRCDGWEQMAMMLEEAVPKLAGTPGALPVRRMLASIKLGRLGDRDGAEEHYRALIHETLPRDDMLAALDALSEIYRTTGRPELLVDVLRRKSLLVEDPAERKPILLEMGTLQFQTAQDAAGAFETMRQILQIDPQDRGTLERVVELASRLARWQDLADALERLIGLGGEPKDLAELRFELGNLYEERFFEADKALDLYARAAADRPGLPVLRKHLEAMISAGKHVEKAAAILAASLEAGGEWDRLVPVLEAASASAENQEKARQYLKRIAEIQLRKLGQPDMALLVLCRVLRENPEDLDTAVRIEELAAEQGSFEEVAIVFQDAIERTDLSDRARKELALKLAVVHDEKLSDPDSAMPHYETVFALERENLTALIALDRLYRLKGEWLKLTEVLEAEVRATTDEEERLNLIYRLAKLWEEKLDEADGAIICYRRLTDVRPDHKLALKALEKLYDRKKDWTNLGDVLEKGIALTEDADDRKRLKGRLAEVSAWKLGRIDEAVAHWRDVLSSEPGNEDAFQALERIYDTQENWRALADLMGEFAPRLLDRRKALLIYQRLGNLLASKLSDRAGARAAFQEALGIDPKDIGTLRALKGFYAEEGAWEELCAVLRRMIPIQDDPQDMKELRLELMDVLGTRLGRRDEAVDAAKRALDIEPHDAAELDRVAKVMETLLAWDELAKVLALRLAFIPDDASYAVERSGLFLRIAGLYRRELDDVVAATEYYEHAHETDPSGAEAYEALSELYAARGEWRKLVSLYDSAAGRAAGLGERIELLKKVAGIYRERLDQPDMAFITWCRIYREDFNDVAALETAEKLADETESYEELHALYEEAGEAVQNPDLRVDLLRRSARVMAEHLGEAEQAEAHFRSILEIDPKNLGAIDALAAAYEGGGKWTELIDVLDGKVPLVDSIEEKVGLRLRIGAVWEQKLGNVDEAIASYRRGLELDGTDRRVLDALASIYASERRFGDLLQTHRRQIDAAPDRAAALAVRLKVGALLDRDMGETDKAVAEYRGIVAESPECIEALRALEEIFTRTENWEDLVEVFEKQIAVEPDLTERVLLHSRAAALYEERFGDLRKAAAHLEDLLVLSPGEISAVRTLERLYEAREDWEKLVDTQQRRLELLEDAAEQVAVLTAMAEVYYAKLQFTDRAEEVYNQILRMEPRNLTAVHALAQMYERSGNWFNAMEMLQREAEIAGAGPDAVDLWFRMGKIQEDMLLDPQSAKDCYRKALDLEPSHLPSIRALKVIYSIEKNLDQYIGAMLEEAQYTDDASEKTRLYYEVGRIYEEEKNDRNNAAKYYEESLKVTPTFLPAAKILADIYFKEENWTRAEACTETVASQMDRATAAKDLSRLYYRLGYITEKMKDYQKALKHYQTSYEIDSTYLPVLEGLANTLVSFERWDDAIKVYQRILVHHKDNLSETEIADLYFQMGSLALKLGADERAIKSLQKVLEIDDKHQRAIEALLDLREARGEYEEAFDLILQLIGLVEGPRRFELYMKLGALCRDKLEDPYRALDAFQGAMRSAKEGPDQLPAMAELYGMYRATRQAQKAASLLEQMVLLESDPGRLVSYWFDLGETYRVDLADPDKAVEAYNKVLNLDPTQARAFIAIEELLAQRKDWRKLEENYRAMIQRTPKEAREKRLVLWRSLGELYLRALRNPEAAIMAYEVVAGYNKENVETLETLAELYTGKEKYREKAVKTHHTVLRLTTTPVKSCRALKRLYLASREYDKVYAICSVLRYLKQSDAEEEKLLAQLRPRVREIATRAMTDQMWESGVVHAQAKSAVNAVLVFLRRRMPDLFAQNVEDFGVKRKDAIDVGGSQLFFVNMFKYVTRVMNIGDFVLYRAPAGIPGLRIVHSNPPALLAGEDMFRERPKKDIWFALARELVLARPEFIIPATLSPDDFLASFGAALSFVNPALAHEGNRDLVERWRKRMAKYLTDDQLTALRAIVSGYLGEKTHGGLEDWLEGVEFTCNRAGFLLTGDLDAAMAMIQALPARLARSPFRTHVRKMVMYAISEEYLALREKLGLAIQV
jgi:tetratricopeptide (TPR) repeat protein